MWPGCLRAALLLSEVRMDVVQEYLPLALGLLALFWAGLWLALQTQGGRESLAAAAVRLAVAVLALAERWLAGQFDAATLPDGRTVAKDNQVTLARVQLKTWLRRRKGA